MAEELQGCRHSCFKLFQSTTTHVLHPDSHFHPHPFVWNLRLPLLSFTVLSSTKSPSALWSLAYKHGSSSRVRLQLTYADVSSNRVISSLIWAVALVVMDAMIRIRRFDSLNLMAIDLALTKVQSRRTSPDTSLLPPLPPALAARSARLPALVLHLSFRISTQPHDASCDTFECSVSTTTCY